MEDMRRPMEGQMREMEEKLITVAKIMDLEARESWKSERQQLLDEKRMLQRKLSLTEEANRTLESDLNRVKETTGKSGEEISSHNHFSALKERYNQDHPVEGA
ncbi:vicilin-like seed storage protein At2g18540 [Scomber scombrus]|uniref:Vicilin-like seed storage protein At2g18540 n=1 Tax=Scomber scombrus TaxID=13677 RepID=A0AAV1PJ81_SCOSC